MQIFSELLKHFQVEPKHKPSLPPAKTPEPERAKVTAVPTRQPINRQAALIMRPAKEWEKAPPMPAEKLKTPKDHEIDRLTAELKTERNAHAATRDQLGSCRQELRQTRAMVDDMAATALSCRADLKVARDIIRQLEDMKL